MAIQNVPGRRALGAATSHAAPSAATAATIQGTARTNGAVQSSCVNVGSAAAIGALP